MTPQQQFDAKMEAIWRKHSPKEVTATPQDLRCIGRYGLLFALQTPRAMVGEDGTIRLTDAPVRQSWCLPEPP